MEKTPYAKAKRIKNRELRLSIARVLFGRKPPKSKPKYVNIGAGDLYPDEFLDADIFPPLNPKRWSQRASWMLDIRFPLKCNDNYFEGILCEHTIEHILYSEAVNFINECYRVLKPGQWLRLSVPDIEQSIKHYHELKSGGSLPQIYINNQQWNNCTGPADQIDHTVNEWGHVSLWDYQRLEQVLKSAGFKNVKKVDHESGTDKRLIIKQDEFRIAESLYAEAQKPL